MEATWTSRNPRWPEGNDRYVRAITRYLRWKEVKRCQVGNESGDESNFNDRLCNTIWIYLDCKFRNHEATWYEVGEIWIQKFNDFWLASTKRVQWTLNHRSDNFIIPPGKDLWLASSIGLPWPLTIRHLLGVAPSTFTVVYICCLKKNTPVGMGMFGNFFVHPPILTTKRPKSFSVTGLRTSEGISISYDTIKDYHDIKIYKAYVIIVLSHVIWYYINWVDWTIDEFQVLFVIWRHVWCFVFLELCCISGLTNLGLFELVAWIWTVCWMFIFWVWRNIQ